MLKDGFFSLQSKVWVFTSVFLCGFSLLLIKPSPVYAEDLQIDFASFQLKSYGRNQDKNLSVTPGNNFLSVSFKGNGWKKTKVNYTIKPDTILEFDFESSKQGEIHGIGFSRNNALNKKTIFQLFGTQKWGQQQYHNYSSSSSKHYTIPVGKYYTGFMKHLVFANDHDVRNPKAKGKFTNIHIYEPPPVEDICGDGILIPKTEEQCDDGNTKNNDGCSSACIIEFCGDGIVQSNIGERCEGETLKSCSVNNYPGIESCTQCQLEECYTDLFCGDSVCTPLAENSLTCPEDCPPETQTPSLNQNSPIGTNLGEISDYSSEYPFVNVFKSARPWISGFAGGCFDCAPPLDLDEHGWIKSLPTISQKQNIAHTFLFTEVQGQFPSGQYTVLFDGEGTIIYNGAAVKNETLSSHGKDILNVDANAHPNGIIMSLVQTNPDNYLRNIRVIMPGGVCGDNPFQYCTENESCTAGTSCEMFVDHYEEQIFHPTFLNNQKKFKALRFMGWMRTNDSDVVEFSDYPKIEDAFWQRVPVEIMVDLANRLHADPWFNIPDNASDNFIREFAQKVKNSLNSDRKVYVEYSNETWYVGHSQHIEAALRGCDNLQLEFANACDEDLNPGNGVYCEGYPFTVPVEGCYEAAWKTVSEQTVHMHEIFTDVFGSTDRLVRLMTSEPGNTALHEKLLSWNKAYLSIDALAIPYYFGEAIAQNAEVENWTLDDLFYQLYVTNIPQKLNQYGNDKNYLEASFPDIDLYVTEWGQSLASIFNPELTENHEMNALFNAANNDHRMNQLYSIFMNAFKDRDSKILMHYFTTGKQSKYGRWGTLEYQDQPHDSSEKYRALMDFIEKNPCWWDGCTD